MNFFDPVYIVAALLALSIHEWAHAYVAYRLGDPTAFNEGRLTINPIAHLDPVGSILILLVGFGWAKPVPVNSYYFSNPKRDTALVAFAGPLSNLILAFLCFVLWGLITPAGTLFTPDVLLDGAAQTSPALVLLSRLLGSSIFVNLALMAFNLLPIPPLDGSKVIEPLVPLRFEDAYHAYLNRGQYLLLAILFVDYILNIPVLSFWVFGIMEPILNVMERLAQLF